MSTDFTLQAKGREDKGKGASRRLRRLAGEIPGVVYGGKKDPAQISLIHKDVVKAQETPRLPRLPWRCAIRWAWRSE